MSNEGVTTIGIIEIVLALVGVISLIGPACFLAGHLSPKLAALEKRAGTTYKTINDRLCTLEEKLASARAEVFSVDRQIRRVKCLLLSKRL